MKVGLRHPSSYIMLGTTIDFESLAHLQQVQTPSVLKEIAEKCFLYRNSGFNHEEIVQYKETFSQPQLPTDAIAAVSIFFSRLH